MKMWGGRFTGKLDPAAWALNASLRFDYRLADQDVRGSIACAEALEKAGVLSSEERFEICEGLEIIRKELQEDTFIFHDSDEDIHTAVERRLGEIVGSAAGKLHTGRSRNDQVATDLRLWLLDHLPVLQKALAGLQHVLLDRARQDLHIPLPGYTHLQPAQPILLSHWWLSHFWPLQRDLSRLADLSIRCASLPLGSGALAGVPFPVDRHAIASALGFRSPSPNSLDAVADRDFVAEFLFCCAMVGVHLSKLAEVVILFSTAEFGFFELSDAYATGSSLMPQKKNPDVFEITRGKAGQMLGLLTGFLAILKALPSSYDKDLQDDKIPLFTAYDTLMLILPVLEGALRTLTLHPHRMLDRIDPSMMATDLADYLVRKGIPFREAHHLAGEAVKKASEAGADLSRLSLEEYQAISTAFEQDIYEVFDPMQSINRRAAYGGSAAQAVVAQIDEAARLLEDSDRST
jgi:argininosuccinate lyase